MKEKQAQLTIVTGFIIFYSIFEYMPLLYASIALGLIFLFIPFLGDLIVKGWFKLAEGLGWINSRILLSVVFFLLLFPLALLSRISKKDPLNLRRSQGNSLFRTRNHTYTPEDMKDMW